MNMKHIIFISCVLITIGSGWAVFGQSDRFKAVSTEIVFCQFDPSDALKKRNVSFTASFAFRVNSLGKPIQIIELKNPSDSGITEKSILSCIAKWTLPGLPQKTLVKVNFTWEHSKGWTELEISASNGFRQKMKIEGERCPYKSSN